MTTQPEALRLADELATTKARYWVKAAGVTDKDVLQARAALEAALLAQGEPDTRCKVKLGSQYGSDLAGHWFYLCPADECAEAALAKHSGISHPAPVNQALLESLKIAVDTNLGEAWVWPVSAKETWLKNARAAIAAAGGEKK